MEHKETISNLTPIIEAARFLAIGFACHLVACRTDMTAPISPDVQLTAEEVAVTEAWLKVHIEQSIPHDSIRITRNDADVLTIGFQGTDTLLITEKLLPKQSYSFKFYNFCSGK